MLEARILILAQGAYATLKEGHRTLDVRLSPGRKGSAALRIWVAEEREKARRRLELADFAERGAAELEARGL